MTAKSVMALIIVVFAIAVTCSVVCPEQTVALANHRHDGVCTDCISTDFIGGAKVSDEPVLLDAPATVAVDLTAVPVQHPFIPVYVSATTPLMPPDATFLLNLPLLI